MSIEVRGHAGVAARRARGRRSVDVFGWSNLKAAEIADRARSEGQIRNSRQAAHTIRRSSGCHHVGRVIDFEGVPSVVMTRDIHERKRAGGGRNQSDERFRLVARANERTSLGLGPENQRTVWNDGVTSVFGYDPSDVGRISTGGTSASTTTIAPGGRRANEAIEAGDRYWVGSTLRHADGSYRPISTGLRPARRRGPKRCA